MASWSGVLSSGTQLLLVLFVFLGFFIPTATTNLRFSLEKKRWPQRLLFAVALMSAAPALIWFYAVENSPVSFAGTQLLQVRFEKPAFREDQESTLRMFLTERITTAGEAEQEGVRVDPEQTQTLRYLLDGYLTDTELNAFSVLTVPMPAGATWLAVRVRWMGEVPVVIAAMGPDQTFITHWGDLPPEFTDQFNMANGALQSWQVKDATIIRMEALMNDGAP